MKDKITNKKQNVFFKDFFYFLYQLKCYGQISIDIFRILIQSTIKQNNKIFYLRFYFQLFYYLQFALKLLKQKIKNF